MTDYKEKIQRLQQLVDTQEDKITSLTAKLTKVEGLLKDYLKPDFDLIVKGNSTITPIPVFEPASVSSLFKDREIAIKKMNKRNQV
jgi:hypothetical protein